MKVVEYDWNPCHFIPCKTDRKLWNESSPNECITNKQIEIVVKSSKHMISKKQNKKTVGMETLKRHRASAWNVQDKKEEVGLQTQLYHFFNGNKPSSQFPASPTPPPPLSLYKVTSAWNDLQRLLNCSSGLLWASECEGAVHMPSTGVFIDWAEA